MKKIYKFVFAGMLLGLFLIAANNLSNFTKSPCIQKNKIQTNFHFQESPLESTLHHFISSY